MYKGHVLLPLKGEPVQHKDLGCQKETSDLALVQSKAEEVQGAAPIHGRASHVEREAGDGGIHEDTKIVTKIGASYTQSPHAGQHQDGADGEQNAADEGLVHRRVERLLIEGDLVEVVTQDAQREDREGQEVASSVRTTEEASQDAVVVLCDDPLLAEWIKVPFVVLGT